MGGRQAHGRPLLGAKPAAKPSRKSKSKVQARALDAFGIASAQYPTKEKRTPRYREIVGDVGKKRRTVDEEEDDEEDDEDEDDKPRRKRVKPSAAMAGDDEASDEFGGSDSEGNEWRFGVDPDDDSEIDSDEAFGESDKEASQGYSLGGSKKKAKQEDDSDGDFDDPDDFDPGNDGESLGDEAIDLAQALDMAESDESDEEEGSAESGSEGDDESDPVSSDDDDADDEEADPSKLDALQNFLSEYGGQDEDEDGARDGARQRQKITFKDLGLTGLKDPQMKKSVKLMAKEEKETRPGATKKLAVPLSKRQQDQLTRSAAYEKTKETLDRWTETVKHNRRADHLVFPLPENAHDEGLNHDEIQPITAKNPGNELEETIMSIMTQSGLALNKEEEGRARAQKEADEQGLSKEALKELVNQKRRQRELNSREAKRQKRIKKIKSKAYHRLQRKQRERDEAQLREAMLENGEIDSEAEREAQDRARALERVGARHRESRWAKAGASNKRAVWDDDYRAGLHDMARREEELRRRKEGRGAGDSSDDDDSGSDGDSDDDDGGKGRLLSQLEKADKYEDDGPESRLMQMKFMQKAEAAQKQANDEMIAQIRRDLDSDASAASDDEAQEVGRRTYGGEKSAVSAPAILAAQAKKNKAAGGDGTTNANLSGAPGWEGPDGAANLNSGFSITAESTAPKGDAWSSAAPDSRKKSKRNGAGPMVGTINTADIIGASSSKSKSKLKAKAKASKSESEATNGASADGTVAERGDGADSDADSDTLHLPLAIRDIEQLDRAFAGDDVVVDFESEKALLAEEQDDKIIDETLPGWGSWVGEGVSARERSRHKGRFLRKVEGTKKKDRKDHKLEKVIINEKRVKNVSLHGPDVFSFFPFSFSVFSLFLLSFLSSGGDKLTSFQQNDKFLASQLPHPFESRAQYERSLRLPMGPEWMTKESFQEATKPRVLVKQGIIAPMSRPSR